ncbi:hypothetical protein DFH08DRAFT_820970 [Mycena albidolilacea]|uniref:Uncharacterized protein n=1 Tax=Mycena albidolilacea TaxID=1033008 RepID=A0AAD6ZBI4_9AGAR|nr:hypothetical protein DFH08DRAFT_820970 [Mycena albidolilacea]
MASPRRTLNRVPKPSKRALAASESPKFTLGKHKKTDSGAKSPGSSTKSSSSASRPKASASSSNSKISISSDSDANPELSSHTKSLSNNHSSLGRSTSITLLGNMDDNSSGEFEGEPNESNNMSQGDEDEGSEDDRQRKRAKQDKATKKGIANQHPKQPTTTNLPPKIQVLLFQYATANNNTARNLGMVQGCVYMGWIQDGWTARSRTPGQRTFPLLSALVHYKRPASDPTHYDRASVYIGVKANKRSNTLQQSFRLVGVKAKSLAQTAAGSQREHPSSSLS